MGHTGVETLVANLMVPSKIAPPTFL